MIEALTRLLASMIGSAMERAGRRVARAMALSFGAAAFLAGVIVFLIIAGYSWLCTRYPPIEAALLMAAALLVLAILCVLPLVLTGRRRPRPKPTTIAEDVAPFVDILKAAGCHTEAASLLAGAQLAGQIRPTYLVVTAMVVGLILGRKLAPRAPPEKPKEP